MASGLKLLNPGEFEHAMSINDNETFFVDNYSEGQYHAQISACMQAMAAK